MIASATQSPTVMPRASAARRAMSRTGGGTPRTVQRALARSDELGRPRALDGRPRRPRALAGDRGAAGPRLGRFVHLRSLVAAI